MRSLAAIGALMVLTACASTPPGPGAPANSPSQPRPRAVVRAQPGDTVHLVEHYVRAERRVQFEDFVYSVLWPAFQRTAGTKPARAQQTRLLRPVGPNEDGTFTYTFVLDPAARGESYNILDVLREVYPEEEARQQYTRYTEMWARDFVTRTFVQATEPSGAGGE